MANSPPPYSSIAGITRTVMKDNSEETVTEYDGFARPGELVVDTINGDIYLGNSNGNLNLVITGGGSGNSQPAGPVGAVQFNAGADLFGGSSNITISGNNFSVAGNITSGNIVPIADNIYTLGTEDDRWANLWLGPGTIHITDSANISNVAELSVSNGILQVNGAEGLQSNLVSGNTTVTLDSNTGDINLTPNNNTIFVASEDGIEVNGYLKHSGLEIDEPNYINIPLAGIYSASTTKTNNVLIYPRGSLAVTWTMPPNPVDGQVCAWTNAGGTSVFFTSPGANLVPSISGPYNGGTKFRYVYRESDDTWYAIP